MTSNADSFRVPVDPTNPGQFLACGGLLCLAEALRPGATGHFAEDGFQVSGLASFWHRLADLRFRCLGPNPDVAIPDDAMERAQRRSKRAEPKSEAKKAAQQKIRDLQNAALSVELDGQPLMSLDWWLEPGMQEIGFKTWAGGQVAQPHLEQMAAATAIKNEQEAWAPLPPTKKSGKPFYFDSRVSRLTSLDLGFSAEKFGSSFSPAVELLAMIGLQRFRPVTLERREWYGYATWPQPLTLMLAALAASTLAPELRSDCFRFPLVRRTGGKYKAFGPAESASFESTPPEITDA